MRKSAFLIVCGAIAVWTGGAVAQDRYDDRRDGYERRDDRRDDRRYDRRDGRWDDRRDGRWGPGGEVVLFEHDGFRGEARALRGDEPDLTRLGFNDRVSSMRISRGAWAFCEHAYYQGKCWIYDYDAPSLPKKQNDRYSSVRRVR